MGENFGLSVVGGFAVDDEDTWRAEDVFLVERLPDKSWRVIVSIVNFAGRVRKGTSEDTWARTSVRVKAQDLFRRDDIFRMVLLEGNESFAVSVEMHISADFRQTSVELKRTLCRPTGNVTRGEVIDALNNPFDPGHRFWSDALILVRHLYFHRTGIQKKVLGRKGALEAQLILDEILILTNVLCSRAVHSKGYPLLFRNSYHKPVHSDVDVVATRLGVQLRWVNRKFLARDLAQMPNRVWHWFHPSGHNQMGLPLYATFTSPLRKYQDLVNQRILLACIDGESCPHSLQELEEIAQHINAYYNRMADRSLQYRTEQFCGELPVPVRREISSLPPPVFCLFLRDVLDGVIPHGPEVREILSRRYGS